MRQKWARNSSTWPILEEAGTAPDWWQGWPGKKRFALVLTHDVEGVRGVKRCLTVSELERSYGFRSSFNFVCIDYPIDSRLFEGLRERGFEIGIHGLNHRGNPFQSRKIFSGQVPQINACAHDWGAAGFRSPCMYHNLDWIADLDIEYDASTFDVDPFEPQPDGVHTIFPFVVLNSRNDRSYVELPYTMPQDSTLFVFLKERTIDLWKKKLDWIVQKGGMALLITHPDYMNFEDGERACDEYPADLYREFLKYVRDRYEGQYWCAPPKDVTRFWLEQTKDKVPVYVGKEGVSREDIYMNKKKIWIDLDNTPHIPFFKPIAEELERRGYQIVMTARDAYQVVDMAERFGLKYHRVGRHFGKNKLLKVFGTILRGIQMVSIIKKEKPVLAISHGSRSQLVAAHVLGIPTLLMYDYEYARALGIVRPTHIMVPEIIPDKSLCHPPGTVFKYPGIKEDVYVPRHTPNPAVRSEVKVDETAIVVTIRPPATEAHYFNPLSEELFEFAITYLIEQPETQLIVLPRNKSQEEFIRSKWPEGFKTGKVIIPDHAIDGLDLMWYSDLVISGGGTMNREAAALRVPVYSIFRGTIGAVDDYLSKSGRLVLVESIDDFRNKVVLKKRDKGNVASAGRMDTFTAIVDRIVGIVEQDGASGGL